MRQYNEKQILDLEKRYRTNLINSLSGFKSANLVGTIDNEGLTNLAIFSSAVHIGANPPLMSIISRPDSVPRHTLENIIASEKFTINHVNEAIFRQAHQTSARYKNISEFEATQLTPEFLNDFEAPYVKEANIKIGLSLADIIPIKINNTKMIIGKIEWIYLPENSIENDGKINLETAGTIAISGLDTYHKTEEIARLPYAKPTQQ